MLLWVAALAALLWVALWLWREARLSRARAQRQSPEAALAEANAAGEAARVAWDARLGGFCRAFLAAGDRHGRRAALNDIWDAREVMRAEAWALGALKRRLWVDTQAGRQWVAARLWYAIT